MPTLIGQAAEVKQEKKPATRNLCVGVLFLLLIAPVAVMGEVKSRAQAALAGTGVDLTDSGEPRAQGMVAFEEETLVFEIYDAESDVQIWSGWGLPNRRRDLPVRPS